MKTQITSFAVLLTVVFWSLPGHVLAQNINIPFVTVGNPGNPNDTVMATDGSGSYGAVSYTFEISEYDVTNAEYTSFLNAVDPNGANTYSLWNSGMEVNANGGVLFSAGAATGAKYSLRTGYDNRPVIAVSFFDAMRFTNWLDNGQGSGSTETGAYMLNGDMTNGLEPRNANAQYWTPSESEWYKAAYYDPTLNNGAGGYWQYPTRSNNVPIGEAPNSVDANSANFGQGFTTNVGAYTLASSYYGTFDQAGNVWDWNETVGVGGSRGARGGAWSTPASASSSDGRLAFLPTYDNSDVGFRVAGFVASPEPTTALLLTIGAGALLGWRRRAC